MKWIFLVLMVGLVPMLTGWLRQNRHDAPKVWMLIGILPFVQGPWHLFIAPVSWAVWPGYVKGLEVALLDAIALSVLLSLPSTRVRLPIKVVYILYIVLCAAAVFQSDVPMASFFYVWQLLRMLIVVLAVAKLCRVPNGPIAIFNGACVGLCYQAVIAVSERLSGTLQAGGTFGHQNLLGMISFFVVFPGIALLLGGAKGLAPKLAPVAGLLIAVSTASRATIGLFAAGFALTLILSAARRWTSRKATIAMASLMAVGLAAPFALASLDQRFAKAPLGSYDERAAFEQAARSIVSDHPMGIGPNMYVIVANTQGYSARAGVVPTAGSRGANVHNTYLLTAAETGYPGLAALVLLFGSLIFIGLRTQKRLRDLRGDHVLGHTVAITIVSIHCFYEWIFVTFNVQYLLAISMGLIAGMAQQSASERIRRRKVSSGQTSVQAYDGIGPDSPLSPSGQL